MQNLRFLIGISDLATIGQTKYDKHMYRELEARFSLFLAF